MSTPPSEGRTSRRFLSKYVLLRTGLALVLGFVILQIRLDYVESWLYDVRVRLNEEKRTSGHIEMVMVQPDTIQRYKRALNFDDFALFIQNISADHPKAVLFTFIPTLIEGTLKQKEDFNKFITNYPNVYFVASSEKLEGKDEKNALAELPPLDHLQMVSSPKTWDTAAYGNDGVTRRMLVSYQGNKTFPPKIAAYYNPSIENENNVRGLFEHFGSNQVYVDFKPAHTYPITPFENIIIQNFPKGQFTDKVVLLGFNNERNIQDYIMTPYSREIVAMPIAEMQANMIDTMIFNSAPIKLPNWLNVLLTLLVCWLTVAVSITAKPLRGIILLIGTFASLLGVAIILFMGWKIWLPIAHPLFAIFLCYYFFIPYRLIVENRRSWEYYQKNKLLSQVEELKGNFISMMSHDLKTPIARIQGMIDVILRDPTTISHQQREAVDTIKHSSDDLLRFISSILNYAQIESQGIELHLQSRDINALLKDVVKKYEFLAKLKKIQIVSELEPLFPIQVDPELIKQVFSNLLENAIKYSPEDTKILITSEESQDSVVVQVSDQGPGIPPDELSNIFMKFFRSKNAKSSPIKGSGLGLYLAKYFTELHKGRISAESTIGQGSTFTVELPINLGR